MRRAVFGAIIILAGLTMAVMGSQLFVQNFVSVPATTSVLTANCATLYPSPSSIAPGSQGGLFFGCTTNCTSGCALTGPAISVAADGAATPTFSPPSPYTGVVALVNVGSTPPTGMCSTFTGTTVLTSGSPFSFTGNYGKGNSFYYCVQYLSPPGSSSLPSFDVSWTQ